MMITTAHVKCCQLSVSNEAQWRLGTQVFTGAAYVGILCVVSTKTPDTQKEGKC